jgi:hypothetical protein
MPDVSKSDQAACPSLTAEAPKSFNSFWFFILKENICGITGLYI